MNYVLFSMYNRLDLVVNTIFFGFNLFIGLKIAYARPLDSESAATYLMYILISISGSVFGIVVLNFIGEMSNKLKMVNKSSISLLNGMHEGLLILS